MQQARAAYQDFIKNSFEKVSSVFQTRKKPCIGIIKINSFISDDFAGVVFERIRTCSQDSYIRGILVVINSGGGSTGVAELLFREIKMLACTKPVVVLITGQCCSCAYMIASGTNWIIAPGLAVVGCIGVVHTILKHSNQKVSDSGYSADVKYDIVYAGKFKGLWQTDTAPLTPEERAMIQEDVDADYKIFLTIIAQQRNISLDTAAEWADGKMFNGYQALEKKLIDQVGGFSDAVEKLKVLIRNRGMKIDDNPDFIIA